MQNKLLAAATFLLCLTAAALLAAELPSPQLPPALRAFGEERLPVIKKQLPLIIKAAEAGRERMAKNPKALINVPYGEQQGFAEELVNRSGGLANALPAADRPAEVTGDDILLFSLRSWEKDWPKYKALVTSARQSGKLTILFASQAGAPADLAVDFLVDNGAATGSEREAGLNAIANIMNGWLWCCEYAAALSRTGKYPAILMSAFLPGSDAYNRPLQTRAGRHQLGDWDPKQGLPAGQLAEHYIQTVERMLVVLGGERTRTQIEQAAELIAQRLAAGKKVAATACSHFLMGELFQSAQTPWKPFNVVYRAPTAFTNNLQSGDLLLFFGYIGLSSRYEDYARFIRAAKFDFVASYLEDKTNPANNAADALSVIEQNWEFGDAALAIPFPPGHMAPVSGVNQGLLYRMLDDAAAVRLKQLGLERTQGAVPAGQAVSRGGKPRS